MDIVTYALAKKYTDEHSTDSGVLVAMVDQTMSMPTARTDGSPLQNEDYVKPKKTATFPFTINGITFENKFSKAIYFNGEWVVDVGLIQDTAETPLANMAQESFEEARQNQKQVNIDTVYQLKNAIIEYENLDTVPTNKLYKRIYRQTADTDARIAGLYWRNFSTNEWEKLGGSDISAGDTLPSGKYDGELFILLADVTGNPKTKKGLYRYNGNLWVHIAHTEPWTSEIEVKDAETESISKTTTTQEAINKENALIIGQDKEIDVDEEVDLIGAVNWLNENKLTQMKLKLESNGDIKDEDGNVLTLAKIIELFNSKKYWMFLDCANIVFLPTTPTSSNEFKFLGDFSLPEEIADDEYINVESFAEVVVKDDNKGYYSQFDNETTSFKMEDIDVYIDIKNSLKHPEKFYPTVQAVIDYVDEHTAKLYKIDNSIEYGGAMIPKFVKADIIAIADYLAKGINVTIKDKYNAYYSVIRADHLNDGEYEIEHEYYDGKSIVWTYMTDGDAITYKMVEPILVDKEYDALETVNKTVIGAINELNSIETYQFKGYVSKTAPIGTLKEGELWYLGEDMPTTFPINVKEYKNGAWSALVVQYTPTSLDLWADLENKHGYYWFGNAWNLIDIDIEVDNETIDFNDAGQIKVADEAIKNKHINPELKATVIEADDDDQLATEGAVYGELIKETTFELDETGAKDKLTLKVTNNSDNDIINKEIEFDKVIIKVSAFPTANVNFSHFYLLTEDTDDYDAGLYYAVNDGDNIVWTKAGANEGIVYVDALPETDIDTQVFYYLKAKVDDFEAGLYYAVLKDDGTYKWHYLEESGIVAVEDEDTGVITFENGSATPYEAIIAVDALPTTNIQTGFFYRLKANVGDYEAGMYYAIKNDDGTYTWAKDGASIIDQIKIVKYWKNMDSVSATDGVSAGEYKQFEVGIALEGYEPVAILNPRCAQPPYYDKTLDYDDFNDGAVMIPVNVKFKLNDTSKVVGAMANLSPKNVVWHYMTAAFDVMYFKKV